LKNASSDFMPGLRFRNTQKFLRIDEIFGSSLEHTSGLYH
jgi:hypothetical protein